MKNNTHQLKYSLAGYRAGFQPGRSVQSMLRLLSLAFVFTAALLVMGNQIFAQEKWNATLRSGVNFPTRQLGGTELNTGFGFDGTIGYRVMPHLFINGGWGWNRFAADDESSLDYEETGYLLGLQFVHPIGNSKLSYITGVGASYKHIEAENSNGDLIADTGHGWGWQAEAGLGIQLGKKIKLVPTLRYSALSRDLKLGTTQAPVDLNYFSGGVGISWRF